MNDNVETKPRIITVFSAQGGSGKTTVTTLLARRLSEQGKDVLIVDLDGQATISDFFGTANPTSTIADVFPKEGGEPAKALDEVIAPAERGNVWIAPADSSLYDLGGEGGADTTLRDAIEGMERRFDSIIIDCCSRMDVLAENAVRAIEAGSYESTVVIPTSASASDMAAALMGLRMISVSDCSFALPCLTQSLLFAEEVLGRFEGRPPVTPYKVVTNRRRTLHSGGCVCDAQIPRRQALRMLDIDMPQDAAEAALDEILG